MCREVFLACDQVEGGLKASYWAFIRAPAWCFCWFILSVLVVHTLVISTLTPQGSWTPGWSIPKHSWFYPTVTGNELVYSRGFPSISMPRFSIYLQIYSILYPVVSYLPVKHMLLLFPVKRLKIVLHHIQENPNILSLLLKHLHFSTWLTYFYSFSHNLFPLWSGVL